MAHILVVDDERKMRHLLSIMLSRKGHQIDQAGDGKQALEMLRDGGYDMAITDIKMPGMDGMALLDQLNCEKNPCPVIFITAFATVDSAVEAMKQGAVDYITKPFEEERILLTVERTLKYSRILAENRELKQELRRATGGDEIIYHSDAMAEVMELAAKVARSESAVLIRGESGTGKELLARYIHRNSSRGEGRFVPVNCAAISANLVESELFGHEKGAFTGADRRAVGKFEYAAGGTLFLDEIGDLPLEAQAKLLRALQEKRIQRVGGNEEIGVDVRVVCATNQDLEALVEKGAFRQDLYFRINVFPIVSPPLRKRKADILPLAEHFLGRMGGEHIEISEGGARLLENYPWPGNVRELANAIERSVILLGSRGTLTPDPLSFLKAPEGAGKSCRVFELPPEGIDLEGVENDLVRQSMEMTGGNQTAAAKLLGLTRAKFRVLMKQAEKEAN